MAFIAITPPGQAQGELADVYRRIAGARGAVAMVHQAQSLNPRVMAAHLDLYKAIMFQPSSLSRAEREAIGVAVSEANSCAYCVAHHHEALARLGGPPINPALLDWARRLARTPEDAGADDVARLRELGYDDRAILDTVLTVAYFSFVNRLVLGTGIELEPGFEQSCDPEFRG